MGFCFREIASATIQGKLISRNQVLGGQKGFLGMKGRNRGPGSSYMYPKMAKRDNKQKVWHLDR